MGSEFNFEAMEQDMLSGKDMRVSDKPMPDWMGHLLVRLRSTESSPATHLFVIKVRQPVSQCSGLWCGVMSLAACYCSRGSASWSLVAMVACCGTAAAHCTAAAVWAVGPSVAAWRLGSVQPHVRR